MSDAPVAAQPRSQYVEFWNNILVPKFVRWRHILVGGLTLHSKTLVQGHGSAFVPWHISSIRCGAAFRPESGGRPDLSRTIPKSTRMTRSRLRREPDIGLLSC